MLYGLLFSILSGIQWGTLNIAMSKARRSVKDFTPFYVIGGLTALLLILLSNLIFGCKVIPDTITFRPIAMVVLGTSINAGANICIMSTLGYGASALYLALSSMGFAVSFLWTTFARNEQFTILNVIGITSLCLAVALSAFAKQPTSSAKSKIDFKRLSIALLSTLCGGSSQICFLFAGTEEQLPAMGKTGLIMLTYVIIFGIAALIRHAMIQNRWQILVATAMTWGTLGMTSYATIFLSIRYLSTISRSGIAFPIGVTIQLAFFTLYTRFFLKEKLSSLQIAALILIGIGVFALRM